MNGPQHRMLLVEDDSDTRHLLRRILSLCGWEVLEAASISEAMARLDPPPDCLILDLGLPDGDGGAILRTIRAKGLPTRVVVNTGIGDPTRLSEITDLHPDCLLHKPLDAEGLRTISAFEDGVREHRRSEIG
jgi:DNA-binding response OmpR family regulator